MNQGNLSRRGFLARSLAGLTAAGLPLWYAKETFAAAQERDSQQRRIGPNDRIVMAAIGTGSNRTRRREGQALHGERGVHIMQDAMRQNGVQMVAVCDVDRPNAEFAANVIRSAAAAGQQRPEVQVFTDFRELLRNRNIDAVTIGTPDHWHALIAIAAMRAGKDVYCEKPLTLTIAEGRAMVRTARATGKIVQTGSQQRSDARFRLACELVRNGRIGTVRRIETRIGDNPVGGPFAVEPPPEGLDWNFWLGPTPRVDYVKQRCHYDFRWWYEYSGGKMTDWGAHHNDIAQWALGMDESGPIAVLGRGEAPSADRRSFNCHPHFEVTYTYGNGPNGAAGTRLVCMSRGENGIRFEGDDGKWLFVSRGTINASDGDARTSRLITEALPQNATRLAVSNNHMGNFMDSLRSRQQPICHVGVGYHSVSVCHLGNIATRFFEGQQLSWNPREERFTGANAAAANAHLSRPYREPWRLDSEAVVAEPLADREPAFPRLRRLLGRIRR